MAKITKDKLHAIMTVLSTSDFDKVEKILFSKLKTRKELFELARSLN